MTLAVGVAAAAIAATVTTGSTDPAPTTPAPSGVTLSMSVEPGQPVPLELITETAAAELYDDDYRGQGIDVALVDSGVATVVGLDQPGKVVYGPDLSNEGSQDNLANLDTYGHGTHLAGIIAGDDDDQVGGIAPESRIVSVKVAGATGETDIAQVIAGIDWVIEHKNDNGLNVRVLNLSLGVDGLTTNEGDPFSAAVERAWDAGIVVVAAAGNRGNESPGIDSPAISPYVIAVGGTESFESSGEKDQMATWSSGGNEYRTPDVVAPGRSIMSLRVPGSMLDQLYPEAAVGDRYFRGTGTSQSAAVVSGFTAALLSADPSMTPDQVKFLFEIFADDVAPGRRLDGNGKIDVSQMAENLHYKVKAPAQNHAKALPGTVCTDEVSPVVTDTSYTQLTKWSGWSTNSTPVLTDSTDVSLNTVDPSELTEKTLVDAQPIDAQPIEAEPVDAVLTEPVMASDVVAPCTTAWSGGAWNGATWSGGKWNGATWSGVTWSGATWSGGEWHGATWSGATWSGATWSGATWSGATWSGATWSGATWSSKHWSQTSLTGWTWS